MGKRKWKDDDSKKVIVTPILQVEEDSTTGVSIPSYPNIPNSMDCEEIVDKVDLEKLEDISVTEVEKDTYAEDDIVEPEDQKLKTLGIIHPCGGTRFYNRMFPDIPFQYIGKNPTFLGLTAEHRRPPLKHYCHSTNTTSVERYTLQEICNVFEDRRTKVDQEPVKNGIANILRKNHMEKSQKQVPVQSFGNAFEYEYGGLHESFEAIEIAAFGENDILRSGMCNLDSFFISNPEPAQLQSHPFPVPGAHSSTQAGSFGESVNIQNQRAELEDVGSQIGSCNNADNIIEVIDLSNE